MYNIYTLNWNDKIFSYQCIISIHIGKEQYSIFKWFYVGINFRAIFHMQTTNQNSDDRKDVNAFRNIFFINFIILCFSLTMILNVLFLENIFYLIFVCTFFVFINDGMVAGIFFQHNNFENQLW